MIPIYEQKNGRGIGYSTDDFFKRFGEICTEHAQISESSKFAFILYDFSSQLRQLLREQGVFAELDRLARDRISVFYLHTASRQDHARFRDFSAETFGVEVAEAIPCLVQFEVSKLGDVARVHVLRLQASEGYMAFHELYTQLESFASSAHEPDRPRTRRSLVDFLSTAGKTFLNESLRTLAQDAIRHLQL
jgi:hypothetical protein